MLGVRRVWGGWRQILRNLGYDVLEAGVGLVCREETAWALEQKKVMDKTNGHKVLGLHGRPTGAERDGGRGTVQECRPETMT